MPDSDARPVDLKRWRSAIVRHLEDLPRQYAALEHAMASFGSDFDLPRFKEAYNTSDDMDAYNRVQAVERALGRVQNYVGELAEAGVKLAALPRPADTHRSSTEIAFEAMRHAKIISASLCGRLVRAQSTNLSTPRHTWKTYSMCTPDSMTRTGHRCVWTNPACN